jgi:hypothetical protein
MYDRQLAINLLVDSDLWDILHADGDNWIVTNILTDGFKGYNNYTDEELMQELTERDISYLVGETE